VVNTTTSWWVPGDRLGRSFGIRLADQPSETHYTMSHQGVDYHFFDTYGIALIAGRKFLPTDHKTEFNQINSVILNSNAVKLLGIDSAQNAIGREVIWWDRKYTIVGVVQNFHQQSLRHQMEPMIFGPTYGTGSSISIKLREGGGTETISTIEQVYRKFFPDNAFSYSFLEDRYQRQYNDDNRFAKVIVVFTGLAIIISCLGLIGLSSYMAVQRTKEIGIRKVLGASLSGIVTLLSADFMRLVGVANILALPAVYMLSKIWLESYAYRITPKVFMFILPAALILLIAAITISFQVLKTAMTNPADTLKYE
jgi:putative ABC transport system permease protein